MPENRTIERRVLAQPDLKIEKRSSPSGGMANVLVGYASVFNEWATISQSDTWVFRERVMPGAYSAAIAERQDVRCLFNHDPNFVLGRTASGTLALRETDRGLVQETSLSESQTIRDLVVIPIERQDITGMSFKFLVRNGASQTTIDKGDGRVIMRRDGERITEYVRDGVLHTDRELLSVDLFDVTVATYPAYRGSSIDVRSVPDRDELALLEAAHRALFVTHDPAGMRWLLAAAGRLRLAIASCD